MISCILSSSTERAGKASDVVKRGVTDFLQVFEDVGATFFDIERDVLIVLDECGNISRVNPAFERYLGRQEINVIHHEIIRYIHPGDLAAFIRSFDTSVAPQPIRMVRWDDGELVVKLLAWKFKRTDEGQRGFLVLRPVGIV
jgi:PAS domain S-box-containing protein